MRRNADVDEGGVMHRLSPTDKSAIALGLGYGFTAGALLAWAILALLGRT